MESTNLGVFENGILKCDSLERCSKRRISNFPDDILQHILSFLDTKYARDMNMHVHHIGRTRHVGYKDGTTYMLITQKQSRFAGELVNSLIAAGKNVPKEVMDLAMKDGRYRSKRDARKRIRWRKRKRRKGKRME